MSFDRLARHYSWMEWLLAGQKLQRCRLAFLDQARTARSILLAGEGHGRFLAALCRENPHAAITCVEASGAMIRAAQERLANEGIDPGRITFHAMPILEFNAPPAFDLVATQFFLDCFDQDELEQVIRKLSALLAPGGLWIVADFQVPPRGWRRVRAQLVLWLAYRFFRATTRLPAHRLIDPAPSLRQHGLELQDRLRFNFDLLYAELWRKPL